MKLIELVRRTLRTIAGDRFSEASRLDREYEPPEGMPALLEQHPRHLTANLSTEEGLSGNDGPSMLPQKASLFFRLPAELRTRILEHAFGCRVIHLDLYHDHPPASPDSPAVLRHHQVGHANLVRDFSRDGLRPEVVRDVSVPKRWVWQSSVCHRRPAGSSHRPRLHYAAEDLCRHGCSNLPTCQMWPGEGFDRCRIGAMGWILACRRAYVLTQFYT